MATLLQEIRAEHPNLNPTETYKLLSKAITIDLVEEKVDYEMFRNALDQYGDYLYEQSRKLKEWEEKEWGESDPIKYLLDDEFREWFEDLKIDNEQMSEMFGEIENIAANIPNKTQVEKNVDDEIRENHPEFHKEYIEHQQWLKANQERLDREEQLRLQDESGPVKSKDPHTR